MNIEWKTYLKAGVSLFILYLAIKYWPAFAKLALSAVGAAWPLILGCIIAYLVNILMSMYESHLRPHAKGGRAQKLIRPVCMLLAFVTLFGIIMLLLRLVVPQLASCVQVIIAEIPPTMQYIIDYLETLEILPEDIIAELESINWQSQMGKIVTVLTSGIGSVMGVVITTVTSVFSAVITAFIGIIFAVYILLGKDTLKRQFNRVIKHYMPEKLYEKTIYTLTIMDDCFHRYIVGQCTEAVILGSLCALGMMLLRLPYATMIGALIAFTALIPVAGAYIGAAVGAFMILTVAPFKSLVFLIFLVILQQLEGNLIYPKVVGSSMGLPAIWVLAAVTIGGGMMGITGMLLGVPLAATAYRILKNDVNGTHSV